MTRKLSYVLAAALFAVVGSAAGGCSLVFGIHEIPAGSGGAGGGGGNRACDNDVKCDNSNPCAVSSCKEGFCVDVALPDGPAPSSARIAGNCNVTVCVSGVAEQQNDNDDIADDSNPCTVDTCVGGNVLHNAAPGSTTCTMGASQGLCVNGVCQILCISDGACDDKNPCTEDACEKATSVCTFTALNGVSTPGFTQIDGDCRREVCVDGVSTSSNDDTNLPKTPTDCDDELCSGGVPSNPPLAADVPCAPPGQGTPKVCDGAGTCVECTTAAQCGASTDCLKRGCTTGACVVDFAPVNTPIPTQTPGDCHAVVCDGAGNIVAMPIIDDTDVKSDNNDCTKDVCTLGTPSSTPLPPGSACGNGQQCNAAVQCGCSNDGQCNLPSTCGGGNPGTPFTCGCTKTSCALLGATCGTRPDACGSTLNCDSATKNGAETDVDCGGGGGCTTTCGQGKACSIDTDCGTGHCADGVCCNTACNGTCVACTAAKKGSGSDGICGSIPTYQPDSSPVNTCVGVNACNGANECKRIDGQICATGTDCVSGSCADGVCCGTACGGLCQACTAAKKGSGADGVCGNIAINQPDTSAPQLCGGVNACDGAGGCKKVLGQSCSNPFQCVNNSCVDSVCCGLASCPACQSCAIGAGISCGNLNAGQPDVTAPNTCSGALSCDGTGNCKKSNGQTCSATPECATGTCVDGVCCGVASCPTCMSCALGGSGTCGLLPSGPDNTAPNTCNGTSSCDGMGSCKKANGQSCATSLDCATGTCLDGVCCGVASCPVCQSCGLSGTGMCTDIPFEQNDNSPLNACAGGQTCDGSGSCLKTLGQMCFFGFECLSGSCSSFVCSP